ncbi:MAG: HNH endonuclease [Planctomycetes bacterium]|nr:HNH endonuclease [Planctomycetota bacterium]
MTQGKFAIIDPKYYTRLAKYKWFLVKSPTGSYAARWQRLKAKNTRKRIWMHHEIIHIPKKMVCDHINRNGLDNRKANLRPATVSQNLCNRAKTKAKTRSKYKGLEWDKTQRKWKARIQLNGRKIYLGSFANEIDAAKAYDHAAKKYHGQFACLNFPPCPRSS